MLAKRVAETKTLIRVGDLVACIQRFLLFLRKQHLQNVHAVCLVASVVVLVVGRLRQLESGDVVEVQHLQHLLRLRINLDDVLLQSGHLGNVVITSLTLLLLQLDGYSAHL